MITIAVDVMGSDFGPHEIGKGLIDAVLQFKLHKRVKLILVGNREIIDQHLGTFLKYNPQIFAIEDATEFPMESKNPSRAIVGNNSILVVARLVKDGQADACLSFGNTGAAMAVAKNQFGMIRGVNTGRPAIVLDMPSAHGLFTAVDVGANINSYPENLLTFAKMGQAYARAIRKIDQPIVGLLANGSEHSKGDALTKAAHVLMKNQIHPFYGNVEPSTIFAQPDCPVDVLVSDGFAGNILLKTGEGVASWLLREFRSTMVRTTLDKLIFLLIYKRRFKKLKEVLGYEGYGAAPLLGVKQIFMVGHGHTKGNAVAKAIEATWQAIEAKLPQVIAEELTVDQQVIQAG